MPNMHFQPRRSAVGGAILVASHCETLPRTVVGGIRHGILRDVAPHAPGSNPWNIC